MRVRGVKWMNLCAAIASFRAIAAGGDLTDGYGMRAAGMGGAAVALAQDAFGAANNPAAVAFAIPQVDAGLSVVRSARSATRYGPPAAASLEGSATANATGSAIATAAPEFALVYRLRSNLALGLSIVNATGLGSNFPGGQLPSPGTCGPATAPGTGFNPAPGPYNLLCGSGTLGMSLSRVLVTPVLAWKPAIDHAVGIAPLFVYQRMQVQGLQGLGGLSQNPDKLTNSGTDGATGWGVRIGYLVRLTPSWSLGMEAAPRVRMSAMNGYAGWLAQGGRLDLPGSAFVGSAVRPVADWLLAADYGRVLFSTVPFFGAQENGLVSCGSASASATGSCLGGIHGAGLGWQDVNVWRLGVETRIKPLWELRAGYRRVGNLATSSNTTLNLVAPTTASRQVSTGATRTLNAHDDITAALVYGFSPQSTGPSLFNRFLPVPLNATIESLAVRQWSLGVQLGHRF